MSEPIRSNERTENSEVPLDVQVLEKIQQVLEVFKGIVLSVEVHSSQGDSRKIIPGPAGGLVLKGPRFESVLDLSDPLAYQDIQISGTVLSQIDYHLQPDNQKAIKLRVALERELLRTIG